MTGIAILDVLILLAIVVIGVPALMWFTITAVIVGSVFQQNRRNHRKVKK